MKNFISIYKIFFSNEKPVISSSLSQRSLKWVSVQALQNSLDTIKFCNIVTLLSFAPVRKREASPCSKKLSC